jgi:nitrogen fixation/metabolism regulation signal transduction histidine kinase
MQTSVSCYGDGDYWHQRVVYANIAARHLLNEGRSLLGIDFAQIVAAAPAALREVIASGGDGLFTTRIGETEETFSLSQRAFMLQGHRHRLYLLKTLTRELSRQEVATWKKLIRVVSHELNNSLGPIASMADTGREVLRRGDPSSLVNIFAAIRERAAHLHQFIADLTRQQSFSLGGPLPQDPGWFDRLQLEQALINVLKNAHESGGDPAQVSLLLHQSAHEQRIEILHRGPGMTELVLAQALLPFYSTKRDGTGLGLALCREIAEAHGGSLRLSNREGGGLCVTVVLPMPAMPQAAAAAALPGYHP